MWKNGHHQTIWLSGIPGAGKTVLNASVIAEMSQERDPSQNIPLLYFFFDFSDSRKQSLQSLVHSLVTQLYTKSDKVRGYLDTLFSSCEGNRQPTNDSLVATFQQMLHTKKATCIIVDALDECTTRTNLLQWMESFARLENKVP